MAALFQGLARAALQHQQRLVDVSILAMLHQPVHSLLHIARSREVQRADSLVGREAHTLQLLLQRCIHLRLHLCAGVTTCQGGGGHVFNLWTTMADRAHS